jgi:hypothetical protein
VNPALGSVHPQTENPPGDLREAAAAMAQLMVRHR